MITTKGKTFIKRYLAGQAGTMVGAISVGIGSSAATVSDERMQFEFARVKTTVIDYDFVNDRIVFKSTLDENVAGVIYEVGIWTAEVNAAAGNQDSKILTSFDSETEVWDVETMASQFNRIGPDSLRHSPAASAVSTSVLTGISLDLVDYSSVDSFILAYNNANANCASIKVRLRTDSANYYEYTVNTPATGYQFTSWNKGAATVVGAPSWADINEIAVVTTATSGGSAQVDYDGLRVEDTDTVAPEYGLVARFIPSVPVTKNEGIVQDIEYALPVSIT